MSRTVIVTDSSADLPHDVVERLGIVVVPHTVRFGSQTFKDGAELTPDEFLTRLTLGGPLPEISSPNSEAFEETFRALAIAGNEIVAVLVSSRLADAVQSAMRAAKATASVARVEVVDSLNVSLGLGFQVIRAAELAATGMAASDIATALCSEVASYQLLFFVDTLDHLKRGGRIGAAATIIGSLLQLKPVLQIDEGLVVPYDRARTKARAIGELQDFVASWPAVERLGVLYASDRPGAERLAQSISGNLPSDRVIVAQLGPMLMSQLGPDVLGVCVDVSGPG